ncbi:MAG: DegT/DnrJ/EryC1/StrS family aminotransferase [Candidatus Woesearchaeota archaeon]
MIPRRDISLYGNLKNFIVKYLLSSNKENYFKKFKISLDNYFGVGESFLIGSGRQSFHLIFDSLDFDAGDEIIIPNYYLKVLIPIMKSKGLVPVYCDIDKDTLSNSLDDTLNKISNDTKFIILPHMFGICTDIDKFIKKVKEKKRDILIIEDCAHSFGSNYKNKPVGTFGDFSIFSFDYIKPLNLLGGGALLVNNFNYLKEIKKSYSKYLFPKKIDVSFRIFYYFFSILILKTPLFLLVKLSLRSKKIKKMIKKFHNSYSDNWNKTKISNFQSFLGFHQLSFFNKKQKEIKLKLDLYGEMVKKEIFENTFIGFNSKYSYYFLTFLGKKDSSLISDYFFKKGIDIGIKDDLMDLCIDDDSLKNSKIIFDHIFQIPLHFNLKKRKVKKISNCLNILYEKGWI